MEIQPLYYTIITPRGNNYNNEGKLGKHDFVYNTQIDRADYHFTNRVGVVQQIPVQGAPYEVGDEVIVHHNVFRKFWNQSGGLQQTQNHIEDNVYRANDQEIFGYRKPGGEWIPCEGFALVKPTEHELIGVIFAGPMKGQTVIFTPNSEYRFDVDGEVFYKMRAIDVAATI